MATKTSNSDVASLKSELFENISRIGKAISAPVRLEIIELLTRKSANVEEISNHCNQSLANISRHLQILKSAKLVESSKSGKNIIYQLPDKIIMDFLKVLKSVAYNRLSDLDSISRNFYSQNPDLAPIDHFSPEEAVQMVNTIVIDVRPQVEYESGHISGALNVPIDKINEFAETCDRNCRVIAYCRGPYCTMALEAVAQLRAMGINAGFLKQGFSAPLQP
ncbi:MAG: hypothetical protein CVV64_16875 [Candidatus Wallbacteria bacterium HGW-Wallbacteria-1]|jgi:rhodanese-related sulfurtransferase/predicted transcriptional regulator|uniref:ArsR family transcriptional regulator n=1 Tax=Candidatus Wallbacteria bacterium HGW-Wallbacteria-1 TaxID=2013854 RepID=A0A2N1PKI6_9BACT|nr:MAG: hypothetical protein CVV64_16875 [Candidatus Wallbacteria bacterium HGW-Wallbacteria-1]